MEMKKKPQPRQHDDDDDVVVVNGVSCTSRLVGRDHEKQYLLAVTTGSRHFPSEDDLELDAIPLHGSDHTSTKTAAASTTTTTKSGSLQIYQLNVT
jgi:hypothetical protein